MNKHLCHCRDDIKASIGSKEHQSNTVQVHLQLCISGCDCASLNSFTSYCCMTLAKSNCVII